MHQVLAPSSPSHEVSSPDASSMASTVTSHDIRDVLYREHFSRQLPSLPTMGSNYMLKQQNQNMMGSSPHDFPAYISPFFYHLQQAIIRSQQQQQQQHQQQQQQHHQQQNNQKLVMDTLIQQSSLINEHRKSLLNSFIHQLPPSFYHFQSGKKFHPFNQNGKMMMMMAKDDDSSGGHHESKMESETVEESYDGISSSPKNKKNMYSPSCAGSDITADRSSPNDDVKPMSPPFKGRNWLVNDDERSHSAQVTCPVCKQDLNIGQIQLHLMQEIQQLRTTNKISSPNHLQSASSLNDCRLNFINSHNHARGMSCKSRYETFARVRNNREARLAKVRRSRKRTHDQMTHPLIGQQDEHVINARPASSRDEDETIDVISVDDNKEADIKSDEDRESSTTKEVPDGGESRLPPGTSKETNSFTCNSCLTSAANPTISTICWHVMCEQCWKKAITSQEKCPQCDVTTKSCDLKKIFI